MLGDETTKKEVGGCTLNSMRVARQVMKGDERLVFFGSVGDDEGGRLVKGVLEKEGIGSELMVHATLPTGRILVLVVKGERSFCCDVGAATDYSREHLKPRLGVLERAKAITTEGYFFVNHRKLVLWLAEYAHSVGKLFSLSINAGYLVAAHPAAFSEAIYYADLVFTNEEEVFTAATQYSLPSGSVA